jgi:hypothetical protein
MIENKENNTKEESGAIAQILPQLSPPDAIVAPTPPAQKNSPNLQFLPQIEPPAKPTLAPFYTTPPQPTGTTHPSLLIPIFLDHETAVNLSN